MKYFIALVLFALLIVAPARAVTPDAPDGQPIQYITRYQLMSDKADVYGIFDIGNKPSVKLVYPSLNGGRLRIRLHGRHYQHPVINTYAIYAGFEDVTGRVFQTSSQVEFKGTTTGTTPTWFSQLEKIAGLYGDQTLEITVPPGTSIVNLYGDDLQNAASPNQLLGYISHLQYP